MAAAQMEGRSYEHDLQAIEMFNRWMALDATEKVQFVEQVREIPGATAIADALERHRRQLEARAA